MEAKSVEEKGDIRLVHALSLFSGLPMCPGEEVAVVRRHLDPRQIGGCDLFESPVKWEDSTELENRTLIVENTQINGETNRVFQT